LKLFATGARTHTGTVSEDGNLLVVSQERSNGQVRLYDISMIDQPNDLDNPVLLSTLSRTSVGIDAHSPHHPHLHGNLLFLAWYEAGLQVFNITDPSNPIHVGAFDTYVGTSTNYNGNWGVDLSMGLSNVLLSDRTRGLIVVNASNVVARGDYDQDLSVDEDDYLAWRRTFGEQDSGQHIAPLADGNENLVIDSADYVLWRKFVGQQGVGGVADSSFPAVPEPSTAGLLLVGFGLMIARRRAGSLRGC
jgi:hypothetical protein